MKTYLTIKEIKRLYSISQELTGTNGIDIEFDESGGIGRGCSVIIDSEQPFLNDELKDLKVTTSIDITDYEV